MAPENEQTLTNDIGDTELEQWLTSVGDGAEINLPGLDIGIPVSRQQQQVVSQGDTDDDSDTDDTDDSDDTDDGNDDTEATTSSAQPTVDADSFTINGQQFPRADIERLYQFDQYMRSNPDVAKRLNDAIATPASTAESTVPAAQATATSEEYTAPDPPEFLDLDDPVQKFQWDNHVATQKVLHDNEQRQRQFFQTQAQERQATLNRQAQQDMDQALSTFKQQYPNLNDDDITHIRAAAGPFIEGMMKQLSPTDALVRSMEVAGMMDENVRNKMTDVTTKTPTDKQKTRHRKARLGEISGSGRSAPRTESRPSFTSDKEMLNALANEFSEQMQR
jgi:hypothetical protein